MLNFLIIFHYNISLQCNSGQEKDADKYCVRSFYTSTLICTTVLSWTSYGNVKGGMRVTNTLLNMLNNYYIATPLDVTIVNANLVSLNVPSQIHRHDVMSSRGVIVSTNSHVFGLGSLYQERFTHIMHQWPGPLCSPTN